MLNFTYADDTVLYCTAPAPEQAFLELKLALDTVQQKNAYKSKGHDVFKCRIKTTKPAILTSRGTKIEFVSNCRYLGILIDKSLLPAVAYEPKMILGFYF